MSACVFLMRDLSSSSLLFMPFMQNDEISLVITAKFMNACGVCSVCSPNCPSLVRIWNDPVSVLRLCG